MAAKLVLIFCSALAMAEVTAPPSAVPATPTKPMRVVRTRARRVPQSSMQNSWAVGPGAVFNGTWGSVSYSSNASKGLGYGIGLNAITSIAPGFRVQGGAFYQYLRLSRLLDGSGTVTDTPAEAKVSTTGVMGRALLGYLMEGNEGIWEKGDPQWWFDGGAEFLLPLKTEQETSFSGVKEVAKEKFFFLVAGPSVLAPLKEDTQIMVTAQFFISASGVSAFKFYGVRAELALLFGV